MLIRQSAEDYFETIYMLKQKNGSVRAIDVVNELGFSKPTVSVALKNYKEAGLVTVSENGHLSLTALGREIAEPIYERHNLIADFLVALGVDKEIACQDACKLEHDLSEESFKALKTFYLLKIKQ